MIASAFADVGFDVDIGPLFATADEAARQAVENDVVCCASACATAHLTAVVKAALAESVRRDDVCMMHDGGLPRARL